MGVFQRGVGHFKRKFQVEGDVAHQFFFGVGKLDRLPFHVISKYRMLFRLVTKHVCDSQTDRIMIPKTALAQLLCAVKISIYRASKNCANLFVICVCQIYTDANKKYVHMYWDKRATKP